VEALEQADEERPQLAFGAPIGDAAHDAREGAFVDAVEEREEILPDEDAEIRVFSQRAEQRAPGGEIDRMADVTRPGQLVEDPGEILDLLDRVGDLDLRARDAELPPRGIGPGRRDG
jgi:hypothetical protein